MPNDSFASVAEDAPALIWRGDADGRCVYLNRAQRAFWGVADDAVGTFTWGSTLLPEDADQVYGPFGEGMARQAPFRCEGRYRRADGEVRILETVAQPRFENGRFVGMVGVNTDVTDQRAAQALLEASEARQRLMVNEMSHRVKNILATVLSIASMTGRSAASLEAFNETFSARIVALAKTHDLLTGRGWAFADLREVLETELRPYGGMGGRRLTLSGEPIRLDASAAVNLALIVHELATNAAKYGAYAADGALEIGWTVEPGPRVVLDWVETGGPPVAAPARTGFGSRLIESLLKADLAGDFTPDYRLTGLVARLRFRPSQSGVTL
ncbi:MAG: HWE histidine kinase domain-containing protein [Caulobacter sp.]|nr:HWE histidine kinase domain-containing protein [Caulobacter sp.]